MKVIQTESHFTQQANHYAKSDTLKTSNWASMNWVKVTGPFLANSDLCVCGVAEQQPRYMDEICPESSHLELNEIISCTDTVAKAINESWNQLQFVEIVTCLKYFNSTMFQTYIQCNQTAVDTTYCLIRKPWDGGVWAGKGRNWSDLIALGSYKHQYVTSVNIICKAKNIRPQRGAHHCENILHARPAFWYLAWLSCYTERGRQEEAEEQGGSRVSGFVMLVFHLSCRITHLTPAYNKCFTFIV